MPRKKTNLILIGIDSLRSDHMSLYGYPGLTTPHIDRFARQGTVFENLFSPHIPTTPGYASMFTGLDCFGMDVVALRHKGGLRPELVTLAEWLEQNGYATSCVGFSGNPASRGFQKYIDYSAWGSWEAGRSHKAENLNQVTLPELRRLAGQNEPFFLFMRHMDPHSPYLPPAPFERMFYAGNECDPKNKSLDPVYRFKPFADYFRGWFPPNCTDKDYIIAQYDGAVAYMDACLSNLFREIESLGLMENSLIVITSDHGETLYDHECWFDHHGLYDCTLTVPLVFVQPGRVPAGGRIADICRMQDVMPTMLNLMGLRASDPVDGRSLMPRMQGRWRRPEPEFYITECTWMRKHGWRTPEWKLIQALEPDLHFKPEIELYNLIADPEENHNLAQKEPATVRWLMRRMEEHIQRREKATGRPNPMTTNLDWHGKGCGPFTSSEQAYQAMHIGSAKQAAKLQAKAARKRRAKKKA